MIYWFTGQPASGKTTLANMLQIYLNDNTVQIDGDDLREIFQNKDYSEEGRIKNIRRAQDIARFLNQKGFNVIVSLVSPYLNLREEFKQENEVTEIYLYTSEDRGRNNYHVGNYEPPKNNFIYLDTTNKNEHESFEELLTLLNL